MDDAALVLACRQGDQPAFAAIYDRYADGLHDFCHSVLRDRHEAADAMQETFLVAAQRMGQLREPAKLRAWLYAIARHESLRRARSRQRAGPSAGDLPEVAATTAGPDETAHQAELAAMVDAAADGLAPRDRAILDLHLRQGLDGQELADALGVSPSHSYVLVSRVKDQVHRSLGALLLARFGRGDCPELASVLGHWDGRLTPLLRKRVARHADGCAACGERRRGSLNPVALLSAVPLVPAAPGARRAVLDRFSLISDSRSLKPSGWQADGFPPAVEAARRRRSPWAYTASVAAVLIVVALLWRPGEPGTTEVDIAANPGIEGSAPTTTTVFGVPTGSGGTADPSAYGPEVSVPTTTVPRGGPGTTTGALAPRPTTSVPAGGGAELRPGPGTTDPSTTEVTRAPRPLTVSASVTPSGLKARGCTPSTATVAATVTGPAPVTQVVLHWATPSGSPGSTVMAANGGSSYSATLGPFLAGTGATASAQWWVEATDTAGSTASTPHSSLPVDPCSSTPPGAGP